MTCALSRLPRVSLCLQVHSFIHSFKNAFTQHTVAHILVPQYVRMIMLIFLGELEENIEPKRFSWFSSCWIFAWFAFFFAAEVVFSTSSARGPDLPMQPAKCISLWKCPKCWVMPASVTGQSVPSLQLSECPLPVLHNPYVFITLFLNSKWTWN